VKNTKNVLRIATLSLATVLASAGASAFAQAPLQLISTNAQLDHTLDSRKAMQGQLVTAKITTSVRTPEGVELRKGTELIGKVTALEQGGKNQMTQVALTFTQARLKDGQIIPVKATLLGALPPAEDNYGDGGEPIAPIEPHRIPSDAQVDQESGVLSNIAMHSAVQSDNSGVFLSKKDKIDLLSGTQLQIALAPESATASTGGDAAAAE
jgi:hypothetical protein